MAQNPGLITLGGLPATGKSAVARPVARALAAHSRTPALLDHQP
jgi:adenylylsulfate kinase-like enzyme